MINTREVKSRQNFTSKTHWCFIQS